MCSLVVPKVLGFEANSEYNSGEFSLDRLLLLFNRKNVPIIKLMLMVKTNASGNTKKDMPSSFLGFILYSKLPK